jgi:hypothetical protein
MRSPTRTIARLLAAVMATSILAAVPATATPSSNVPDDTWMTNGQIYTITQSGNTIYIGGKFSSLRQCPPGTSCGPGSAVATVGVGAIDATTGVAIKTFKHTVSGGTATVFGLAVAGGKLWLGGQFTHVDGEPRLNLAAIDLSTGELDAAVDHQIGIDTTDRIRGLATNGNLVYAAGYFLTVDGQARKHLAAFQMDGDLDPTWRPKTAGLARTLTFDCDANVVAGGSFRKAGGSTTPNQARATLAIFDPVSGALDAWTPDNANIPNGVNAFDLDRSCGSGDERLFVGYGGSNAIYAFDLDDDFGEILYATKTGGNVQTVAVRGNRVFFGGHFTQVSVNCSWVSRNENDARTRFATADLDGCTRNANTSDPLDGWTPSFSGKFYGPWDIYTNATQIWVGGQFTDVSGTAQYFLARFTG